MKHKNFYKNLSESTREKILREINITNNEEFVSWMTNVPNEVLLNHFNIAEEVISEIQESELYLTFTASNEKNRFGYIPDAGDNFTFGRKNGSQNISLEIFEKVPSKVNLCHHYNGVQDQGNVGSCVGFGVEGALRSTLDFKYTMSPGFAYQIAKIKDGNQNEGTSLKSCINGILEHGICTEESYPYNEKNLYVKPTTEIFREAKKISLIKYEDRKNNDQNLLEWLIGCLSGSLFDKPLAIAIGVIVYNSSWNTESTRNTGKLLEPYPGEIASSGHAVTIVGYVFDSSFPGGGYFIFRNSWGEFWARQNIYCPAGYGIMSFRHALNYIKAAVIGVEMSVDEMEQVKSVNDVVQTTILDELEPVLASRNKKVQEKVHRIYGGTTGSGKTTRLKHDILKNKHKSFFIIDLHGDFSEDEYFVNQTNAKIWNVLKYGMPYDLLKFDENFDSNLSESKSRILKADFLCKCFEICMPDLGSRQLSELGDLIEMQLFAYHTLERNDIQMSGILNTIEKKRNLKGESGRIAGSLADQLRPLFKLGLLDCKHKHSLSDLLKKNRVLIFKCKLPGKMNHILRLLSVFIVEGIFSTYKISDIGNSTPGVIVQDEFHLMPKYSIWEDITREGRKFGVELWASSQKIEEMEELLPNVGKRCIFRVANGKQARKIARNIGWSKNHEKQIVKVLSELNNYEFFDPLDLV